VQQKVPTKRISICWLDVFCVYYFWLSDFARFWPLPMQQCGWTWCTECTVWDFVQPSQNQTHFRAPAFATSHGFPFKETAWDMPWLLKVSGWDTNALTVGQSIAPKTTGVSWPRPVASSGNIRFRYIQAWEGQPSTPILFSPWGAVQFASMSFPGVDLDLLGGCPAVTWDQPEDLNPAEMSWLLGEWKEKRSISYSFCSIPFQRMAQKNNK